MSKLKIFARHRIWVVTGAASGIGLEMTRALLKCGAVVWALDRDAKGLEDIALDAKKFGYDLFTHVLDVTDKDQVAGVTKEIKKISRRIDVWINNAGIQAVGSFREQSTDKFNQIMDVNFHALVYSTKLLLDFMENQGDGIILNMASVAGHVPAPFMTAYVASKHAVIGFSRALRAELVLLKSPIRCAVASPGFVDTKIIERGQGSGFPDWLSWMLAKPEDCAREILEKLARGQDEIEPTLNGRAMTAAFRLIPNVTVKSSRLLLTKGLVDLVLNRYHLPRGH